MGVVAGSRPLEGGAHVASVEVDLVGRDHAGRHEVVAVHEADHLAPRPAVARVAQDLVPDAEPQARSLVRVGVTVGVGVGVRVGVGEGLRSGLGLSLGLGLGLGSGLGLG